MQYPFLQNNELIIIDYVPGSSGTLLMRLWSELDANMCYDEPVILRPNRIGTHACTHEIEHDILIPKTIHNWWMDKCQPVTIDEWIIYFELMGTMLVALKQRWHKIAGGVMFYADESYEIKSKRVLHGMHSWQHTVPIAAIRERGFAVRLIGIVPQTHRGQRYQLTRSVLCYPGSRNLRKKSAELFNSKSSDMQMDLCTWLVDRDTESILTWFREILGNDYRHDKTERATEILHTYYKEVLDTMNDEAV